MADIRHLYAQNEFGKIIHINDVPLKYSERSRYYSVDTGAEMIARKGKIVAWHFAHKDGLKGSLETYLHQLGKKAFKQAFEESDTFTILLPTPHPCSRMSFCQIVDKKICSPKKLFPFDLKKYYSHCELEKRVSINHLDYVADVCLIPKNPAHDYLIVEIQVTHASTKTKIHSGLRIIEIKIEQDSDIQHFRKHSLSEQNNIKFYGFRQTHLPEGISTDRVRSYLLRKFQIRKNGNIYVTSNIYCDFFASDGEWDTTDALFYLVIVDGHAIDHLDFGLFGLQKAIDFGYHSHVLNLPERYRRIVLRPLTQYYIWYLGMNTPKLINEYYEGQRVVNQKEMDLMIKGFGFSDSKIPEKEQAYWNQILDCIYQDHNGVDIEAFYGAIYLASLRGMYVQLVPPPKWQKDIDDYWINTNYKYVPVLVDEIPDNLFYS